MCDYILYRLHSFRIAALNSYAILNLIGSLGPCHREMLSLLHKRKATAVFLLIRHLVTKNIIHFALKLCFLKKFVFSLKTYLLLLGDNFLIGQQVLVKEEFD